MANTYADRVQETSTTTGTGAYDLDGANTGYQTFVAGAGDTSTVTYLATDGTDWEVGTGVVTDAATDTLSRASILASSNSGSAVNWGAGTKTISLTLPASVFNTVANYPKYAVISDTKSAGTNGGTFTSGAWRTRDLNTEDYDPDGIVSISSNQFTLGAGTYLIEASAVAGDCDGHATRIYNTTDTAVALEGSTEFADSGSNVFCRSFVRGVITIASSKTFELQHYCSTTKTTFGFGVGVSFQQGRFAEVVITQIA